MKRVGMAGILALGLFAFAPSASAFVYWGDYANGRIGRAANDGSGIEPNFITGLGSPAGVAVSATHIYRPDTQNGSIGRANIDGTGVDTNFITGLESPKAVAVNNKSIYWTSALGGLIGRADIDGSEVDPELLTKVPPPCGIALDAGHIYWSSAGFGKTSIGRALLSGGVREDEFVKFVGLGPCGVAVTTTSIYWTDTLEPFPPVAVTNIGRAQVTTGGEVNISIIGDAVVPCGIAAFGSQLFWANLGTDMIGRADIDGPGATGVNQSFIATGGKEICGVAVDSLAPTPAGPPLPAPGQAADTRPPVAKISKGPGKKLGQGIAKFSFSSDEPGSSFRCRLDSRKSARCSSPKTYKRLKAGRHTFKVWATDAAGNQSKPAKRSFRIPA